MTVESASTFLVSSLLLMIGFIIIVIAIVIINNILHKYWKPLKILKFEEYPPRFIQEEPSLKDKK
jgi:hypothetical protein